MPLSVCHAEREWNRDREWAGQGGGACLKTVCECVSASDGAVHTDSGGRSGGHDLPDACD